VYCLVLKRQPIPAEALVEWRAGIEALAGDEDVERAIQTIRALLRKRAAS